MPKPRWSEEESRPPGARRCHWGLVAILLVGLFLRVAALGPMEDMLTFDEAHNGVDCLSLLRSPRLTPFLTANNGRESLWVYLLTPFVAVFGPRPFGLRLAAAMAGVVTLCATYALGRELLGRRGATWAAAVLAVLYWHVHLSHLALRGNLYLALGALALAAVMRAQRAGGGRRWLLAGAGLGLLVYTYFAADLWLVYALLLLAAWFARRREARRGVALAVLAAGLVALPMGLYALAHLQDMLYRPSTVGALSLRGIWTNVGLWAGAWLQRGDLNPEYNVPGRPILDAGLAPLLVAGLISLPRATRRRWHGLWLIGWGLVSVLPSLVSERAPNFIRAVGLVLPIALVAGAGAWGLERALRRVAPRRAAALLPLALLALSGGLTYQAFHARWLGHPEVYTRTEAHANQAVRILKASAPSDMPVYFSPFSPSHPVVAFRGADLGPRPVGAFDSHYCQVVADGPAAYVSVSLYEPGFAEALGRWVDLAVVAQEQPVGAAAPRCTVYQATPRPAFLAGSGPMRPAFGDALELRALAPISPTVRAGETIPIYLGLRALRPLDRAYSVFVHLYGQPTPYEGGRMWSQGDSQVCTSYPATAWRPGETVIQEFRLPVAPDTPAGRYVVAVGIYEAPAGPRLPVTAPAPQRWDYVPLEAVEVLPSGA